MEPKEMRVRLDGEHAATLATLARADGRSQNDTILAGIDALAVERVKDATFRERLRAITEDDRAILERFPA